MRTAALALAAAFMAAPAHAETPKTGIEAIRWYNTGGGVMLVDVIGYEDSETVVTCVAHDADYEPIATGNGSTSMGKVIFMDVDAASVDGVICKAARH